MNVIDEILNDYKKEKQKEKTTNLGNSVSDLKREMGIENNPYARWGDRKQNRVINQPQTNKQNAIEGVTGVDSIMIQDNHS